MTGRALSLIPNAVINREKKHISVATKADSVPDELI